MADQGCADCRSCAVDGPAGADQGLAHRVGNALTLGAVDRHHCPSCGHSRRDHADYESGAEAGVSDEALARMQVENRRRGPSGL